MLTFNESKLCFNRKQSFLHLVNLVKRKQCPYFYFHHRKFTFLFRQTSETTNLIESSILTFANANRGTANSTRNQSTNDLYMEVLSTFSTPGLCEKLKSNLIEFEILNLKPITKEDEDEPEMASINSKSNTGNSIAKAKLAEELKLLHKDHRHVEKQFKFNSDGTSVGPPMLFRQMSAIDKLVNFLIDFPKYEIDLPLLWSPVAFIGGSLNQLQLLGNNKHVQQIESSTNLVFYRIELSGVIMPSMLQSLCQLLNQTQNGEFDVVISTNKTTSSFPLLHDPLRKVQCNAFKLNVY